jgi:hypothetical protein
VGLIQLVQDGHRGADLARDDRGEERGRVDAPWHHLPSHTSSTPQTPVWWKRGHRQGSGRGVVDWA